MSKKPLTEQVDLERRMVLRASMYVAPVIVTLGVTPLFAGAASGPGIDTYPPSSPDSHDNQTDGSRGGLR